MCCLFGCYCCTIRVIGKDYECCFYLVCCFASLFSSYMSLALFLLFFKSAFVIYYSLYYFFFSLPTDLHSISNWLIIIVNLYVEDNWNMCHDLKSYFIGFFYFNHSYYLEKNALVFDMFQYNIDGCDV